MEFKINQLLNAAAAFQTLQARLETTESNSVIKIGIPGRDSSTFELEGEMSAKIRSQIAEELKSQLNALLAEIQAMTTVASPYQ